MKWFSVAAFLLLATTGHAGVMNSEFNFDDRYLSGSFISGVISATQGISSTGSVNISMTTPNTNNLGQLTVGNVATPSATVHITQSAAQPILALGREANKVFLFTESGSPAVLRLIDNSNASADLITAYASGVNQSKVGIGLIATQPSVTLHVSGTSILGNCNTGLACGTTDVGQTCYSTVRRTYATCRGNSVWDLATSATTPVSASAL